MAQLTKNHQDSKSYQINVSSTPHLIDYIYKKSILNLPTQDFTVATGYLKVATPELVALDLFKYPDHAGGLNHIATVFSELIETLDPIKLIDLAKNTNSECQLQRIGYILDHIDLMDEDNAERRCCINSYRQRS